MHALTLSNPSALRSRMRARLGSTDSYINDDLTVHTIDGEAEIRISDPIGARRYNSRARAIVRQYQDINGYKRKRPFIYEGAKIGVVRSS